MKEDLISLLETFGYPIYLQGTLNDNDNYDPSFFTFWNFETPEASYYDNQAHQAVWGFWIYFYSDNPALVETITKDTESLLKEKHWILEGRSIDAVSDVKTHTGKMLTCWRIEQYKGE